MRTYRLSEQILYVLATFCSMTWAGGIAALVGLAFLIGVHR